MHHPDEVDLPEYRQRDLDRRPWWHRAVVESAPSGDKQSAKWRSEYSRMAPQSDRQLRDLIANYYGMISLVDHNVGRILMALDEAGLADNTIVVFSSDHGDWLGDHGLILKGPMHYEGLLKVGLIMRGPGIPAGKKVMEPVSTLDLSPTFNDYAKAAALQTQHGASLRPLIEENGGIRDYAFNEWDLLPARVGVPLDLTTIRTKTHKLTFESGSEAGELYDLVNDPHEMDNRFNDAGIAAVQKELMDMIRARPDDKRPMGVPVGAA
jgi:arylsulfatase A-like enzyme